MNPSLPKVPGAPAGGPPAPIPFTGRLAVGLLGVLIAAMMAGLNNRVAGLGIADIRGHLGWGADEASWLSTAYSAGELVAMPFAAWFAITFSLRRFFVALLVIVMIIAAAVPFIHDLSTLIAVRAAHGVFSGALIPLLMMAALRFMPPPIRLHGLALYALTATFAPNVALWLGAVWLDHLESWRWVYWGVIPLGLVATALGAWGIPSMPMALPRFKQANWIGALFAVPGLSLLVIGLDQGARLDWLNSPLIGGCLLYGLILTALFLLCEWFHPSPFIKLQLLERRNLGLGFSVFFVLLTAMSASVALPAACLAQIQGFRLLQTGPLGLIVGAPQLILGPLVALLLYRKWVDARYVFALGLSCMAMGCFLGSHITSEWMVAELLTTQILFAMGEAAAIVPALFLGTSVVQPMEGPYVAGIINTIRALGSIFGAAVVSRLMTLRLDFHQEMLLDHLGGRSFLTGSMDLGQLGGTVAQQAAILATADIYRIFGVLTAILIPVVLCLQHIPAPRPVLPPVPSPQK